MHETAHELDARQSRAGDQLAVRRLLRKLTEVARARGLDAAEAGSALHEALSSGGADAAVFSRALRTIRKLTARGRRRHGVSLDSAPEPRAEGAVDPEGAVSDGRQLLLLLYGRRTHGRSAT